MASGNRKRSLERNLAEGVATRSMKKQAAKRHAWQLANAEREHHTCNCYWANCKELHADMAKLDSMYEGVIRVKNSNGHREGQVFSGALRHLHPLNRHVKEIAIGRHHFHRSLLEKHDAIHGGSKRQVSLPISEEEAKHVGIFEFIDRYKPSEKENGSGKNQNCFVQVPNFPRKVLEDMVKKNQKSPPPMFSSTMVIGAEGPSDSEDSDSDSDSDSESEGSSQVRDLLRRIKGLERSQKYLQKKVNTLEHKTKRDTEKQAKENNPTLHGQIRRAVVSIGGTARATYADDKFHKENETAAAQWYGFDSWDETKECIGSLFP